MGHGFKLHAAHDSGKGHVGKYLAHTLENKVEAAYMHGTQIEKRRKLMQDWADYVDLPQAHGGNVIPLKSANG